MGGGYGAGLRGARDRGPGRTLRAGRRERVYHELPALRRRVVLARGQVVAADEERFAVGRAGDGLVGRRADLGQLERLAVNEAVAGGARQRAREGVRRSATQRGRRGRAQSRNTTHGSCQKRMTPYSSGSAGSTSGVAMSTRPDDPRFTVSRRRESVGPPLLPCPCPRELLIAPAWRLRRRATRSRRATVLLTICDRSRTDELAGLPPAKRWRRIGGRENTAAMLASELPKLPNANTRPPNRD